MSLDIVLASGRRAAEARMRDACEFRRKTGTTTNPTTGVITPTYDQLYAGKCRVKQSAPQGSPQGSPKEAGEAYLVMLRLEVHVPMSVDGIREGDQCTITASEGDPNLVGRVFSVDGTPRHSDATARRLGVKERTS